MKDEILGRETLNGSHFVRRFYSRWRGMRIWEFAWVMVGLWREGFGFVLDFREG